MQMFSNIRKGNNSFLGSDKDRNIFAFLILLVFFSLSAFSVQGRDKTLDGPRHYKYGMNILNGHSTRFDDSKMPVSVNRLVGITTDPQRFAWLWKKFEPLGTVANS